MTMTRLARILVALLCLLASPALAQSRTGSTVITDASNLTVTPTGGTKTTVKAWMGAPPISEGTVQATGSTTARALKDRFADVVNVRDFGAKGDGSDDSAAVSAAHAAAKAAKVALYFPTGTYVINQLAVGAYDRIIGAGWQRTFLRPKDVNQSVILIDRVDSTASWGSEIAHLSIRGYGTGTGHGIESTATNDGAAKLRMHDVWVLDMGGDGIHLERSWSSVIRDVIVDNCLGHQFYLGTILNTVTLQDVYAKRVPTAGTAGFRVIAGTVEFVGANGLDSGQFMMVLGGETADGDPSDGVVRFRISNSNFEGPSLVGLWVKRYSMGSVDNSQFTAYDGTTPKAIYVANSNQDSPIVLGPANTYGVMGSGAWANGFPLHAKLPPAFIAFGQGTQNNVWYDVGGYVSSNGVIGLTDIAYPALRLTTGVLIGNHSGSIAGTSRITKHLSSTKTWDPPSIANAGGMTSTTVTVTGAVVGDTVAVGFSNAVPAGALLVGAVTAADTVTVSLVNFSATNPLDLASGTLRADVWRH